MTQQLSGRDMNLAREFYRRTRHKVITVDDFRAQHFHELLPHPNAIGAFFGELSREGFIEKVAQAQAGHGAAKGRWVWQWRWTEKAALILN